MSTFYQTDKNCVLCHIEAALQNKQFTETKNKNEQTQLARRA